MTDIIEAVPVEAIVTTEVYVVMCRYGTHYWDVVKTCDTLEEAQQSAKTSNTAVQA